MELEQLKDRFKEIKSWDNSISADMALDCSTRIYNSRNISSKESKKYDSDQPKATDKQIAYLIQLGYEGETDSLTLVEAKSIIQTLKIKKSK